MGLYFLAFWPCGPSFPFILAFSGSASGASPPQVAKNGPFAQRPYNGFISAVTGPILQFLAFWAFISLHSGLVGLHFLSFWPCGPSFSSFWPCEPSFPFILALWAFISFHFGPFRVSFWAPPHKLPKIVRFPNLPYKEFSSAETGSIFQFLAFWAFISFHFGIVGLYFLSFWPCGPSFPFILALRAFISLHFGPFRVSFWPPPHKLPKMVRFPNLPYKEFSSVETGSIFGLLGLHFLSFWPCGPLFPFILALWAFISFYFGLVGLHFPSFWPFEPLFPFVFALWAFISLHFGLVGIHPSFLPFGPSFPCILASGPSSSLMLFSFAPFFWLWDLGAQGVANPPQTPNGKSRVWIQRTQICRWLYMEKKTL